jgi:xanthine dehydrogenase accessory factor
MTIYEKLVELDTNNHSFVLVSVVNTSGSVPGKVGFKMVVDLDGETFGTVGGGEIEKRVTKEAILRLEQNQSGLKEYLLQETVPEKSLERDVEIVPMMCNGKVWIYYDVNINRTPIYIFGGGHVGQAVCYFLTKLNYYITLIDNREEFVSQEKNPFCQKRVLSEYTQFSREFQPSKDSFVVIMTQGHRFDYEVLKILYERQLNLKYIGVIASKAKAASLIKQLNESYGSSINLSNLYTPIGLDIGGSSESEIALSIVSQIQAIRFKKETKDLRLS